MNKERIAELLKAIENLKTMFRAGVNRGKVVEIELYPTACADCIEAIEYLEAALARAEAKVPELTEDALDIACGPALGPMFGPDAIVYGVRMARREGYKKAWADFASRLSTLPAAPDPRP